MTNELPNSVVINGIYYERKLSPDAERAEIQSRQYIGGITPLKAMPSAFLDPLKTLASTLREKYPDIADEIISREAGAQPISWGKMTWGFSVTAETEEDAKRIAKLFEILDAREHQIHGAKYDAHHDDQHGENGDIAKAAAGYLLYGKDAALALKAYPWTNSSALAKGPHRDRVVKAAALALAELERIDRHAEAQERLANTPARPSGKAEPHATTPRGNDYRWDAQFKVWHRLIGAALCETLAPGVVYASETQNNDLEWLVANFPDGARA